MTSARLSLRDRLNSGSSRHLWPVDQVTAEALRNPHIVAELIATLRDSSTTVTHRASNALKKIQRSRPDLLAPHAKAILRATIDSTDLHTRWNLTILLGELPLRGRDRALAVDLLFDALASSSALLRVFALNGLANFAAADSTLQKRVRPILEAALTDPSAAMRARARKLFLQLQVSRVNPNRLIP